MIRYFSADYVFPISQSPIKNGVVALNAKNEIVGLYNFDDKELETKEVEKHKGIITPGFINTHCHLELSHLYGKIPQHTLLIPFLQAVMKQRSYSKEEIETAAKQADEQMYQSGIVAVGDISNTLDTKEIKLKSKLYYHTFVELIGIETNRAEEIFNKGKEKLASFSPLSASLSPHAPYSVSVKLFKYIKNYNAEKKELLSLHNQESQEENLLFKNKTGAFLGFYQEMGKSIDTFSRRSVNSIRATINYLPKATGILFVHNTYSDFKDIHAVERYGLRAHWCFCPNANLYIENNLPRIDNFIQRANSLSIVLGTDSLASNTKLCILSELKAIHQHFSHLDSTETLKWATLNGAEFLGIEKDFGSLEIGKKPGLNLITHTEDMNITPQSTVIKLS